MFRYFLRLLLAFTLIVALLALAGFFLPRSYRVVRGVEVGAAPDAVYSLVGDLARWKDWSPWAVRDPRMETTFSTATAGVGAWTEWRSESLGGGRAEIVEARPPERLRYRMRFTGVAVPTEGCFELVGTGGGRGTHITWTSEARLGWNPLTRWLGLLLRRSEGEGMERGLEALRVRGEKPGQG
jgi:hypothetical protein